MTTTFQKNVNLNLAFGNAKGDVTSPDVERIRSQAKLVLEEAIELMEAAYPGCKVFWQWDIVHERPENAVGVNMKEIMDAQGDITTVNDGVAHIAGFDGDEVLQRVYASNMSKFIRSEDEVAPALQYYYNLGFLEDQLYIEGEFPQACIKVVDTVTINGKEYPKGKFLKNMPVFKEPEFSDLLGDEPKYQTTEIIVSMAVPAGRINFVNNGSIALVGPDFIDHIISSAKTGYNFPVNVDDDKIESVHHIFEFNSANLGDAPSMWGFWKSTVRHFVSSPVQASITGLVRID